MPSQYIKCDTCRAELGADQLIKDRHVGIGYTPELLRKAVELGWKIEGNTHTCPQCIKEPQ